MHIYCINTNNFVFPEICFKTIPDENHISILVHRFLIVNIQFSGNNRWDKCDTLSLKYMNLVVLKLNGRFKK